MNHLPGNSLGTIDIHHLKLVVHACRPALRERCDIGGRGSTRFLLDSTEVGPQGLAVDSYLACRRELDWADGCTKGRPGRDIVLRRGAVKAELVPCSVEKLVGGE